MMDADRLHLFMFILFHLTTTMSFYQIRSRERAKYTTVLHRKTGLNIEKQNDSTQRSKLCVFFRFLDLTFERQELFFKRDKYFVGHREHFHGFVHVAFVSRVLLM